MKAQVLTYSRKKEKIQKKYNISDLQDITEQEEVFIYHGNLSPEALEDPRFIGLSLYPKNNREIKCDLNKELPILDNSVDAFQSEDVIEHLHVDSIIFSLNEIYRILKPNAFCRISLPDYYSLNQMKRSIYEYEGNILGDVALGAVPIFDNGQLKIKHTAPPGDNHFWFPTIDNVKDLIFNSDLSKCSVMKIVHANVKNSDPILDEVENLDTFYVRRSPPMDMRSNGNPISIIIDFVK